MTDTPDKKTTKTFKWRFLVGRFLAGDAQPFWSFFHRAVAGHKTVHTNKELLRKRFGDPYMDDLVSEIMLAKFYGRNCLEDWLDKKYDDEDIKNIIYVLIKRFVISLARRGNLREGGSLEDVHDGQLYKAAAFAANGYQGVSHSEIFESPERILELKETILRLEAKKKTFYGKLNEKQIYILENSKAYKTDEEKKTGLTYGEIAAILGVAVVTVQTNKLRIDKIIKEVFDY